MFSYFCFYNVCVLLIALRWLRGTEDVQAEIEVLKNETEAESKMPKVDYGQLMTNPNLRKPLIISCVIMLSQQFSGINAVGKSISSNLMATMQKSIKFRTKIKLM